MNHVKRALLFDGALRGAVVLVATTFGLAWVMSGQASATTILPMDLRDLVGLSRAVAVVTVVDRQSHWNETHTRIVTEYQVTTKQMLKDDSDAPIVIEAIGGRVGDVTMRAAGIPELGVGDSAVIFLDAAPSELFPVVGFQSGVFRVYESSRGPVVFSHDWRPVVAVERDALVLGSSLFISVNSDGYNTAPSKEDLRGRVAAVSSSCITLNDFLQNVDRIAVDQEAHGYTWRYARFMNRQSESTNAPAMSSGQSPVTTDPALPVPQDD